MKLPWRRPTVDERATAVVDGRSLPWIVSDGFENTKNGVGSQRRAASIVYCAGFQANEATLSDLVDTNWLARRIVRALPEAAMQEKILFSNEAAQQQWDRINALDGNDDGAFLTAQVWARTHGASLLILGQDWGGSPESPASTTAPIEWLEPVRSEDFTVSGEDLCKDLQNAKRFGKPDFYRIHGEHRFRNQRIHYTRIVHFAGPAYSDPMHSRGKFKMVGLSALDPVYEVLGQYALTWSAIAEMMQQASIPVWTLKGLIQGLTADPKGLGRRLQAQNEQTSVMKAILLDAGGGESYERKAVSFADMPEIVKQLTIQVSAATSIPISEIFGRIVSGLGDVGDVEDRKWVRRVNTYRTTSLAPRIARIMPGQSYAWQPITVPSPTEKYELEKGYWDVGVVTDDEMRTKAEEALNLPKLTPEQEAELEAKNGSRPPVDPALGGF